MARAKHTPGLAVNCPACITLAEQARMPWQASYLTVFSTTVGDEIKAKHHAAELRRFRSTRTPDGVPNV